MSFQLRGHSETVYLKTDRPFCCRKSNCMIVVLLFGYYSTTMAQEPLTNGVALSSCPSYAGFLSDRTREGSPPHHNFV